MDYGNIELEAVRAILDQRTDTAWLLVAGGPVVSGTAPLWQAEIVFGDPEHEWQERQWLYPSCSFASQPLAAFSVSDLLVADEAKRIKVGSVVFEYTLQKSGRFDRKPSRAPYQNRALLWPGTHYDLNLVQPQNQFQPPSGMLVGAGAPSFVLFATAYNAFFFGNFAVTGANNPLLGKVSLRVSDDRGRIKGVTIHPTGLDIDLEGVSLPQAAIELTGASDGALVALNGDTHVELPLPHGVPADAWVWLRSDDDWLDYRSLGGWGAHRSPDIRDNRASDPEIDLAAIIAQGETEHVEFKRQLPQNKSSRHTVFKTIVAFANGGGGIMLFGVDDDGTVLGVLDEPGGCVDRFNQMLRASTSPMPACRAREETLADRLLLIIEVDASAGQLYAVTVDPDKHEFFVRRGATTFHARADELENTVRRSQPAPINP